MNQRILFSTITAANVSTGNEASKAEGEKANSSKEEKSGESNQNQSSDSGKPVRGGVHIYGFCSDLRNYFA